jgi:hypothetical protein
MTELPHSKPTETSGGWLAAASPPTSVGNWQFSIEVPGK